MSRDDNCAITYIYYGSRAGPVLASLDMTAESIPEHSELPAVTLPVPTKQLYHTVS